MIGTWWPFGARIVLLIHKAETYLTINDIREVGRKLEENDAA